MISVICLSVAWLIVSSCSHVRYALGFFITRCTLSGAILSNLGRSPRKYPAWYNQIEIICSFMCAGFVLFAIGFLFCLFFFAYLVAYKLFLLWLLFLRKFARNEIMHPFIISFLCVHKKSKEIPFFPLFPEFFPCFCGLWPVAWCYATKYGLKSAFKLCPIINIMLTRLAFALCLALLLLHHHQTNISKKGEQDKHRPSIAPR